MLTNEIEHTSQNKKKLWFIFMFCSDMRATNSHRMSWNAKKIIQNSTKYSNVLKMTTISVYPPDIFGHLIKDEVLLAVGCTIFPPMYLFIAKYLFIGNFKNRSIDI